MSAAFFDIFGAHAAIVAAAAARMRDQGLTPDDVLRLYDELMAARMANMTPAAPRPEPAAPDPNTRRPEGQADTEYRLGACPRCGGEVWGVKKCSHISPPWRTFLACDSETCTFHGRSRLTVDVLRRQWPVGVETED